MLEASLIYVISHRQAEGEPNLISHKHDGVETNLGNPSKFFLVAYAMSNSRSYHLTVNIYKPKMPLKDRLECGLFSSFFPLKL